MAKAKNSPEGAAFVRGAMKIVGVKTVRDLSRALGYNGTDREGRLYAWHRGESAPNHEGTLDLLRISGRLREQPEPAEVGRAPGSSQTLLGELRAAVETMVESQTALVKDLQETRVRLRRLEAAQPSSSTQKGQRTAGFP